MESQFNHPKPPSLLASVRWKDVLKIILALALIGLVFSKTSLQQIIAVGKDVSWSWLGISFVLFCLLTGLKGAQYWVLLRTPYLQIIKIVVIQNALANLIANTAGVASYLTMFRMEQNVNFKRSGTVFILTKIGDLFSMGFFLFISAYLVGRRVESLRQIVVFLLVGIFTALTIFWAAIILRRKFVFQMTRVIHWLRLDRLAIVDDGLNQLQSLVEQDSRIVIRMLLLATFFSLIYTTASMAYYFSKIQIFHIPIDFWTNVFMVSLMQLISLIPIQAFGGLGVRELASLYLYGLFGVVYVDLPAALIGSRVLSYLFILASLLYVPVDIVSTRFKSASAR